MPSQRSVISVAITVVILSIFSSIHAGELHGENICPVEEEQEKWTLSKHEQHVVLHTTRFCWDPTQGFRCREKSNGTKITYHKTPVKVKNITFVCCIGFYETPDATCEICPTGSFGKNCSNICNCTESEECDHIVGCCNRKDGLCSVQTSAVVTESRSLRGWLIAVGVVALLCTAFLLFGTLFYRKKYIKEKDPELPTLTYYPYVREVSPSELETREFNNPLYRQSTADELNAKLRAEENTSNQRKIRPYIPSTTTNDYAEVPSTSANGGEPSCTDPLLTSPNVYEVPKESPNGSSTAISDRYANVDKLSGHS